MDYIPDKLCCPKGHELLKSDKITLSDCGRCGEEINFVKEDFYLCDQNCLYSFCKSCAEASCGHILAWHTACPPYYAQMHGVNVGISCSTCG